MYNEGISQTGSILDIGLEQKIFEKKGAWISYEGNLIGQGREAAKQHLVENPELAQKLIKIIMERVQVSGGTVLAAADGERPAEVES
jgi:recombination protein RecA